MAIYGRPSAPVIERFASQVFPRYIATILSWLTYYPPSTKEYLLCISAPESSAINLASSIFHSGTGILNSSHAYPVLASSSLSKSCLTTLKVSGTIPPTSPL
jgi:hypothetical protein